MTIWHWVRHGPTHEKTLVGWRDVPADLSDTARIARLSAYLPGNAMLVSSDLIRAVATADVLTLDARKRLPHEPDLREMHFGQWDGLAARNVAQQDPELSRDFWATPGDTAPPQGESWNQTARRVNAAVDRLSAGFPDAHIIAVAHFGVILTQVQRALNITAKQAMAHNIENLSATEIHVAPSGWNVARISHCP